MPAGPARHTVGAPQESEPDMTATETSRAPLQTTDDKTFRPARSLVTGTGDDGTCVPVVLDTPVPGSIGRPGALSVLSRPVPAATLGVGPAGLTGFPFTPTAPLPVVEVNPADPV